MKDILEWIGKIKEFTRGNDLRVIQRGWEELRNIVAHETFGVRLPIIWRAIEQDLLPLADGLNKLLKDSD